MLRRATDRLLRGLRAYRATWGPQGTQRADEHFPTDPDDPMLLLRGLAVLSFVAVPVLLLMAALNMLAVPLVIAGLTVLLAGFVVVVTWWVFDRPDAHRARVGTFTVLVGTLLLLGLLCYAEAPEVSTPFWMSLVILAAATILGIRAAIIVTGVAILTIVTAYVIRYWSSRSDHR